MPSPPQRRPCRTLAFPTLIPVPGNLAFRPMSYQGSFLHQGYTFRLLCYPNGGVSCILSTLYPMESSLTMASAFRSASRNYPVTRGTCIRAHAQSMLVMPGAGCDGPGVLVCSL